MSPGYFPNHGWMDAGALPELHQLEGTRTPQNSYEPILLLIHSVLSITLHASSLETHTANQGQGTPELKFSHVAESLYAQSQFKSKAFMETPGKPRFRNTLTCPPPLLGSSLLTPFKKCSVPQQPSRRHKPYHLDLHLVVARILAFHYGRTMPGRGRRGGRENSDTSPGISACRTPTGYQVLPFA